ncbi:MAG: OmpA family protein [Myxococcales bacterium]|nr:OmpA family protein [Myxococcales bacterium]
MPTHSFSTTISIALAASLLAGCGGQAAGPPIAPTGSQESSNANAHAAPAKPTADTTGTISISEEIRKACGIAEKDAHFAFDSSLIDANAGAVLGQVAQCLNTGPLAGRQLNLVGRADPRGESEYNMVLGGARASAVSSELEARGLPAGKITSSSRGEMDASGKDEAGWAEDRRVDVRLGSR